ncbi:uncharacterized protein F4817DRAFT_314554 [Daldinia loculata]|uniref:uncharacterized protein n=1 Tax=Daldinia loculata TaxID=103429 RepID=UPI0020C346DD|nr:uncharacterized protein F4817DRAFT_314554 [Daldinia loculata]KAI1648591.1 hypothetical protein F4817DRAFT_314554 [Daldinia loculata]
MDPLLRKPGWPSGRVPVEVFCLIVEYLPKRATLETLRLVNREFYTKLQYQFFQHLVINVGLMFDTSPDGPTADDITEYIMKSNLLNHAAPFVCRIGLALEMTEQEIASPEIDEEDEIEIREWGVYRWPVVPGSRRSESRLEKITNSLERSKGIYHVLSMVKQIHEFALSCDGGLGYLQGPDLSLFQPPGPQPIFGEPNQIRAVADNSLPSLQVSFKRPYKLETIEKRLAAKGLPDNVISDTMKRLLETEGISMKEFTHEDRTRAPLPVSRYGEEKVTRSPSSPSDYRLLPDQLTETQARFIFQHVTAQQALVQCFIFTVIDHGKSYKSLTKLNIARLSSFHVHLLCRDDFWSKENLPKLREVSLGIVPDWRSVTMKDSYTIETRQVYPTDALPKVFKLLNDHIGRQERIQRLHFEWLCGGELAPGCLQRNNYVLPAPFLKKHRLVIFSGKENLLILPYVTHLSLKNCWFAPNVFYRIIRTMAKKHALESLELETVSLTGPPLPKGAKDRDVDYVPWTRSLSAPQGIDLPGLIKDPLTLSWSHVIDMLTPGPTIKQRVFSEKFPTEPQLHIEKRLKLRKLVFKSCGYVVLPDSRFVSNRRFSKLAYPVELRKGVRMITKEHNANRQKLVRFMQVNTDRHLGRINDLIDPREEHSMRIVFGLRTGWPDAYGITHFRASVRDGIPCPGHGRFSGTIDADSFMDIVPDGEPQAYKFSMSAYNLDYQDDDEKDLEGMMRQFELEMEYKLP